MLIRGVALLAGCFIAGQLLGETLGRLIHINANVGGVGFAMLLLVFAQNWFEKRDSLHPEMESGILFWSKMYIPVIVAMSATQNVRVALSSGLIALAAGIIPVAICLFLVPSITRISLKTPEEWSI
ncbi:malonate transporter subunit MadL [Spirosoma pollinicola]|uniref:Malonate transporter subunit MadL n=1 Tax=Spirosoma pollinicola TaxID=2057025 RepID=A0A2K8YY98_9BACT|nr:malonate transporter subunit MadL [Spirosoma pollinicola]AUD02564.1 malonate transporter subunit MadL [Spirosoma pollinicola]